MWQFLRSLSDRSAGKENLLQPDSPFFAIGDIHGRSDLLDDLLAQIDTDQNEQLVFVGDYVDRGPDSARTLSRLYEMAQRRPGQVTCLMGNHEKMMLDFIDDPLGGQANWLRNGGVTTLESFGISGVSMHADADEAMAASDALEAALPADLFVWLRALPLFWNNGNIWCVHAALDPAAPPDAQRSGTMLWGNRDFLKMPRNDGICVVHGHTRVSAPENQNSRIAIDTGAYDTGLLTAAYIAQDTCRFIQTGGR